MIEDYKTKTDKLQKRIDDVTKEITELEQTKISLIMLKRDFHMKSARELLERSFTPQLKKLLEDGIIEDE